MYALGRPSWASCTAVRAATGSIHLATGWDTLNGTRTACGRYIVRDSEYFHMVRFDEQSIEETFDTGSPCLVCLSRAEE